MRVWALLTCVVAVVGCADEGKVPFSDGTLFQNGGSAGSSAGGGSGYGGSSGYGGGSGYGGSGATCSVTVNAASCNECVNQNCCELARTCFDGPCSATLDCVIQQANNGYCTLNYASDYTSCAQSYCSTSGLYEMESYLTCFFDYCASCL